MTFDVTPQLPDSGLTVAELFAGGGLMAVGLRAAGYNLVWANDFDRNAVKAYRHNLGDHIVHGDITTIDIDSMPDADVIAGGPPCFPAGQRIITQDGFKRIEEIQKGDKVLTHKGRFREVVVPMKHDFTGDLYTIMPKYYRIPIKATAEHPFWTERGFVEAKDLTPDDYLGFPLNKESKLPDQLEYEAVINQSTKKTTKTNLPFGLTAFWELVGYWVADGWTRDRHKRKSNTKRQYYGIVLAANEKKKEYITQVLSSLGIKYHVSQERTCYKIQFSSQEYWLFLKQFTKGTSASDKMIPEFIQNLPHHLAKAFVDGFYNGDGCISNGYISFASTSIELLEGLQRLLLKTEGKLYSLAQSHKAGKCRIEGREVNVKDSFTLKTGAKSARKRAGVKFTDDYVFIKIDRLEKEYVSNLPVFNFEVKEDNSYCLPLIATHNCQDYSVAGTGAGENGERGKLVWAYLRIIEAKRPKAFIFENVKGLITKKHRPTFDALLRQFQIIGYNVSWRLINAWDYGVAQKRERVFIVGIRNDLGFAYEFPDPSPEDYRTKVLRDVIGDLPEPGIPLTAVQQAFLDRNPMSVAKNRPVTMDEPSRTLPAVLHKGVPYRLFYPPNHVQTQATTVKPHQRLSNQRGYVADMDGPGRTVNTCRLDHAEIHPQAPRRFTVRECLRIQSVPDWYVLPDDISLSAQYRIVGNGVASRVAYLLGVTLAEQLRTTTESSGIGERLISDDNDREAV